MRIALNKTYWVGNKPRPFDTNNKVSYIKSVGSSVKEFGA